MLGGLSRDVFTSSGPLPFGVLLALLAGCPPAPLSIAELEVQNAYVGELLNLPLPIENNTGQPLSVTYSAPPLQNLDRFATVVVHKRGADFRWTPILEHLGTHTFTFLAAAASERASQEIVFNVQTARPAAPSFFGVPAGRAFDPSKEPCLSFDFTARDQNTDELDLGVWSGMPPRGASFEKTGPKSGRFAWCPTADQLAASARWTVTFFASDGIHEVVLHDYTLAYVPRLKDLCAGVDPSFAWIHPEAGTHLRSEVGYDVSIRATTRSPPRDHPLLLYTTARIDPLLDFNPGLLSVARFSPHEDEWRARMPTFRLAEDEEAPVTLFVFGTDNTDAFGTRCDRPFPREDRRFIALGDEEAGVLETCTPCGESGDCISRLCAATPEGGRCVPACDETLLCEGQACVEVVTVDGPVIAACAHPAVLCDGRAACPVQPGLRPNRELAERVAAGVHEGELRCQEEQWFRLEDATAVRWHAELEALDSGAQLELHALDREGRIVGVGGAGVGRETIEHCTAPGEPFDLRVFAPEGHGGRFRLEIRRAPEDCACVPAPSPAEVPMLPADGRFSGRLCPGIEQSFTVRAAPERSFAVSVDFDSRVADLDLRLVDADGRAVDESSRALAPERISSERADDRPYTLSVFSSDFRPADYEGFAQTLALTPCGGSTGCDSERVCEQGRCRRSTCQRSTDCPPESICPPADLGAVRQLCRKTCEDPSDCPVGAACKAYRIGLACTSTGAQAIGDPCTASSECEAALVCHSWPGGSCVAFHCDVDPALCGPGALCAEVDALAMCVKDCWPADDLCRRDEGYECGELFSPGGQLELGCTASD